MTRNRPRDDRFPNTVRVFGKNMPVRGTLDFGRRRYLILDELGAAGRTRYMAFDREAGPRGALRSILVLPDQPATWQHVRVLHDISTHSGALPKVLDYRKVAGRVHVALEWVHGIDLAEFLGDVRSGRRPRPSPVEAVRLVRRLAHDLGHIHRKRRIAHGDIKPRNLIVASEPSRLVPIDFGSAWLLEHTLRRHPGDGTSAAYAAPELMAREPRSANTRCDQFSCGVVLYEMLSLVVPFEGLGGRAETLGLSTSDLVPPSSLHPNPSCIPHGAWKQIDEFVARSLSMNPDGRFATPQAWLDAADGVYESVRLRRRLTRVDAFLTRMVEWLAAKCWQPRDR